MLICSEALLHGSYAARHTRQHTVVEEHHRQRQTGDAWRRTAARYPGFRCNAATPRVTILGCGGVPYCPKYPNTSTIRCVGLVAYALMLPLVVGTIARLDVIAPSSALSVATPG